MDGSETFEGEGDAHAPRPRAPLEGEDEAVLLRVWRPRLFEVEEVEVEVLVLDGESEVLGGEGKTEAEEPHTRKDEFAFFHLSATVFGRWAGEVKGFIPGPQRPTHIQRDDA